MAKKIVDIKENILEFLRTDLEKSAKEWLENMNNPLVTEVDFLDQEIELYKKGVERAKELHFKHHHSHHETSVMQNEIVNYNNKIRIAEEWKAELSKKKVEGLTYAAIAIICIYKGLPCSYKNDAVERLNTYNKKLRNYKDLVEKYNDLSRKGAITRTGENTNASIYRIRDIESGFHFLTKDEKINAEKDLSELRLKNAKN